MIQYDESIYCQSQQIPTVYIVVGVPASGKSFWSKRYVAKVNAFTEKIVYISSDDIREEICGDAQDQSRNNEVFEIFYNRARQAIQEGKDVILDATHLSKKTRRKCRNHFKNLNCKFIAVQMKTPIEKAIRRNKNRNRVVPNYAMERMINAFEPVEENEGFDEIWRVK